MAKTPEQKAAYDKRWYAKNKDRLNCTSGFNGACRKIGIPVELAKAILTMQGDKCPGCGAVKSLGGRRLYIDHNHISGSFRGFLCSGCNTAIGLVQDNPDTLRSLATFLERASKTIKVPYEVAQLIAIDFLNAKEENVKLKKIEVHNG